MELIRNPKQTRRYYLHYKLRKQNLKISLDGRAKQISVAQSSLDDSITNNKYVVELQKLGYNLQVTIV